MLVCMVHNVITMWRFYIDNSINVITHIIFVGYCSVLKASSALVLTCEYCYLENLVLAYAEYSPPLSQST